MREIGSAGNIIFDATSMANGFKGNQLHGASSEVEASKNKIEPRVEMPKNEGASRFGLGDSILHGVTMGARNWLRKSQYDLEVHNKPFEIPKNEEWFQTMLKGLSDSIGNSWEIEPNVKIGEFSVSYMNEMGQTKRLNHKSKPSDVAAFLADRENWQEIPQEQGRALVNKILSASSRGDFYMTEDHKMNLIELMEMSGFELEGEAKKREGHHLDREWFWKPETLHKPIYSVGSRSDGKARSVELIDRVVDYGNNKYLTPTIEKDADAMKSEIKEINARMQELLDEENSPENKEEMNSEDEEKKIEKEKRKSQRRQELNELESRKKMLLTESFGRTEYAKRQERTKEWFVVAGVVGAVVAAPTLIAVGVPVAKAKVASIATGLIISTAETWGAQNEEAATEIEYKWRMAGDPPEVAAWTARIYQYLPAAVAFLSSGAAMAKILKTNKNPVAAMAGTEVKSVGKVPSEVTKKIGQSASETAKEIGKSIDEGIAEVATTTVADEIINLEYIARSISWFFYKSRKR
jgi:hypothetical protein